MANPKNSKLKIAWQAAPWGHYLKYELEILHAANDENSLHRLILAAIQQPAISELIKAKELTNFSGVTDGDTNTRSPKGLVLKITGNINTTQNENPKDSERISSEEVESFELELNSELKSITPEQQFLFILSSKTSSNLPSFVNLTTLINFPNGLIGTLEFQGEFFGASILSKMLSTPPISKESFRLEINEKVLILKIYSSAWSNKKIIPLQKLNIIDAMSDFLKENFQINLRQELQLQQ